VPRKTFLVHPSSFILHPSAFILQKQPLLPRRLLQAFFLIVTCREERLKELLLIQPSRATATTTRTWASRWRPLPGDRRTPMGEPRDQMGRDHHIDGYAIWLAGGGIKPGQTIGNTDELGFYANEDRVHVHDLQATVLHLLGLDHTKLTYRFQGRNFRLTDVAGQVVKKFVELTLSPRRLTGSQRRPRGWNDKASPL
jgi:hypothetical protein